MRLKGWNRGLPESRKIVESAVSMSTIAVEEILAELTCYAAILVRFFRPPLLDIPSGLRIVRQQVYFSSHDPVCLRFVNIVDLVFAQIVKIFVDPINRLLYSFFERDSVDPTGFLAQFRTIELVSGIFPQPFTDHLYAIFEVASQARTNHLNQGTNCNYPGSGNMVGISRLAIPRHLQCCVEVVGVRLRSEEDTSELQSLTH